MLAFKDAFNNDDPLANPDELLALNTWYAAFFLVLGNLAGIFPFLYANRIGCYFLAYAILLSIIVSCFYHLCQTTHECFQFPLPKHVSVDHVTSTGMMGLLLLAIFNVRTVCQLLDHHRIIKTVFPSLDSRSTRSIRPPLPCKPKKRSACEVIELLSQDCVYERAVLDPDLCECGVEMGKHFTYDKIEENMIYDSWSAGSAITIYVITVMAVFAHPFSYAAFNIVIAACVIAGFIKIMLIEEGEPINFVGRLSLPELIIGLILTAIGLIAYVLDSYYEYMILHSIWHVAIYLAVMFFLAGTMRSVNGWIPLWKPCCYWVRVFCHGHDEELNEEQQQLVHND